MEKMEEKIRDILVEILDIKEKAIQDDYGPNNAELWDSLNNLRIITALEEAFGITLSMAEIGSMVNVRKIKEVIQGHL
jgi:acyl carrier protein